VEDKIRVMLPCNLIVQETENGKAKVSAIAPIASMHTIDNPGLQDVAEEVHGKLRRVIDNL